jgi:hypothetical protein
MDIDAVWGEKGIRRYTCPISQSAKSKCGAGAFEGLVKWHPKHPATTALNKDVKESAFGGFKKQLIATVPLSGQTLSGSSGDALASNPPAANIRWETMGSGEMESCPVRTGDKDGCPEGTSMMGGSCVALGQRDSYTPPTTSVTSNFMRISGFFRAKMAGSYTFHLHNNAGAKLWIGGTKVAESPAETKGNGCPFTLEGWKLVRRTDGKDGLGHPATDQLRGTDVYGTKSADPKSDGKFSVDFEKEVPGWNEFLFTTGDCNHWMVMAKQAVTGGFYNNELRDVMRSHSSSVPYEARMYRRQNNKEDPWIQYTKDHSQRYALYVGNKYRAHGGNGEGKLYKGLNVYVRKNNRKKWIDASMTMTTNQQVPIVATGPPGYFSKVSVGVTLPSGYSTAPMETQGKGSTLYELCATADCSATLMNQNTQTSANKDCSCAVWPKDYGASGSSCQQPDKDPKEAPWCICKPGAMTVPGAVTGKGWTGSVLGMGEIDSVGDNLLNPFDDRPGAMPCGKAACASYFDNIGRSNDVIALTESSKYKSNTPDSIVALVSGAFETKRNRADQYGAVLEGFVVAPGTGTYTFLTNSDDSSEVWVATKPNQRTGLKKVVELKGCCRQVQGTTQVTFQKGQKYYIRGLVKEGGGGDYLKIGMKHAGKTYMPIPISMFQAPTLSGQPPAPTVTESSLCNAMCSNTPACTAWESFGHSCKMYSGNVVQNDKPGNFPLQLKETAIVKGTVLSDNFEISEEYQFSFDIMPTAKVGGYSSIFHFTDKNNCCGEYERIPAIWFKSNSYRLHVRSGRKGSGNDGCDPREELPEGKWTTVKLAVSGNDFTVSFNGVEKCKNTRYANKVTPKSVKVYAGDPWHPAATAKIKNVQYTKSGKGTGDVIAGKVVKAPAAWSYCEAAGATASGGRRLLSNPTDDDEQWEEAEDSNVEKSNLLDVNANAKSQLAPEDATPTTIDCVDGTSAFARENQLGNARGTSSNSPADKAAIPHALNANRYIWTIPNHVEGNCVLRLRYNISTSDYWAWNNAGTPMVDSSVNGPGNNRRRRGKQDPHVGPSPIVQDPYVGVGPDPALHFVSMSSNTNQFGRTFQDRSHVFEIKARPAGVTADQKIYNLGMRGKRGNIVQTFPSVEYDFMPNDLCINKGDYVHFQWTGSDYNPARNPNDGEGAGDDLQEGGNRRRRASRADRTNLIDQDVHPKIQYAYTSKDKLGLSGSPQHVGMVASGMQLPMGAANPYSQLDAKYTGMFWTPDGKPDKALILKMALLDQHKKLAAKKQEMPYH